MKLNPAHYTGFKMMIENFILYVKYRNSAIGICIGTVIGLLCNPSSTNEHIMTEIEAIKKTIQICIDIIRILNTSVSEMKKLHKSFCIQNFDTIINELIIVAKKHNLTVYKALTNTSFVSDDSFYGEAVCPVYYFEKIKSLKSEMFMILTNYETFQKFISNDDTVEKKFMHFRNNIRYLTYMRSPSNEIETRLNQLFNNVSSFIDL